MTRADRSRLPTVGPTLPFRFSRIRKDQLPNQLTLWSAEHRTLPVVTFMLVLPVGSAADFEGYEGLAAMTGDMIDEGTGNLSAIDVNAAFARIGAHLETDVSADATMFTVTSLAKFARHEDPFAEAREALRTVLAARGIAVGSDEDSRIAGCVDLAKLRAWLTRAATMNRIADILE